MKKAQKKFPAIVESNTIPKKHSQFMLARDALRRAVTEAHQAHPDLPHALLDTIIRTTKSLSL